MAAATARRALHERVAGGVELADLTERDRALLDTLATTAPRTQWLSDRKLRTAYANYLPSNRAIRARKSLLDRDTPWKAADAIVHERGHDLQVQRVNDEIERRWVDRRLEAHVKAYRADLALKIDPQGEEYYARPVESDAWRRAGLAMLWVLLRETDHDRYGPVHENVANIVARAVGRTDDRRRTGLRLPSLPRWREFAGRPIDNPSTHRHPAR